TSAARTARPYAESSAPAARAAATKPVEASGFAIQTPARHPANSATRSAATAAKVTVVQRIIARFSRRGLLGDRGSPIRPARQRDPREELHVRAAVDARDVALLGAGDEEADRPALLLRQRLVADPVEEDGAPERRERRIGREVERGERHVGGGGPHADGLE